jgi:hypothetical protein
VADGSASWKEELVKVADRLESKTKQRRWTARTDYLIERDFVVGAYALRKLIAARDVSNAVTHAPIPVRRFVVNAIPPPSAGDISEFYDFDNGSRKTLSIEELCDEILHSFVFEFCCGETDDLFDGIFLSSERNKNEFVYLLLASDFIALCGDVGIGDAQRR